jgi:hypothetical protein
MAISLPKLLITIFAASLAATASVAETPQERAAKIKEWRANCSDPDPDLRLAYIEAAIAAANQTVIRTCIKQTLTSDNADVRNLALRAALASSERLTLEFQMPPAYRADLDRAGSDPQKLQRVNSKYAYDLQAVNATNGSLAIVPRDVDLDGQTSTWYVLGSNTGTEERYLAEFSVIGDTISGNGKTVISFNTTFNIQLGLNDQGELIGTGKLANSSALPLRIKLY